MESRSQVKKTIREILVHHGIGDKDKLEHIPEAITSYYGGILVEALMDLNADIVSGEVQVFMTKNWEGNGSEENRPT